MDGEAKLNNKKLVLAAKMKNIVIQKFNYRKTDTELFD